jgi:hypothetical protein
LIGNIFRLISPLSIHHDFVTFRIIGDLSREMKASRQDGMSRG